MLPSPLRWPELTLPALAALLLFACGGDPDPQPTPDAGPAADGGNAVVDGGPQVTGACDDIVPLQASANGAGFQVRGTLSAADDFRGSCAPDFIGADAVVEFTAPNDARYRFSTEASDEDLNTIIHARTSCLDADSELACNINGGGETVSSTLFLDLSADQTVYVIVDSYRGLDEREFVLDIEEVETTIPTLSQVEAFFDSGSRALGIRVQGSDPGGDVDRIRIELFDSAGDPIAIAGLPVFETILPTAPIADITWSSSDFVIEFAGRLPDTSATPMEARVAVRDADAIWTDPMTVSFASPPESASGQACDRRGAFSICAAGTACGVTGSCVAASAPSLSAAEAFVNTADGAIAVRLTGTDGDGDVVAAQIGLLDAQGNSVLVVDESGASSPLGTLRAPVTFETEGTDFVAIASGRVPDAVPLGSVAMVEVAVVDSANQASAAMQVAPASPPEVGSGGDCDPNEGLNLCPAGELCGLETRDAPACFPVGGGCPAAFNAIDLNSAGPGGDFVFAYDGSTSGAENVGGAGSCGGGGPQAVLSFLVPATARWRFEVTSADPGADTVLFMRSECVAPQPEWEIRCNDDVPGTVGGLSRIELDLATGTQVFLFVDGFVNASLGATGYEGPFTLRAEQVVQ